MFKQEGYELMGAAFEVCNVQGYGLAEEIYQLSLEIELGLRSIPYFSKSNLDVYYKGQKLGTKCQPDLLVFSEIIVEFKAVKALAAEHESQLLNDMRVARKKVGYLINFGDATELEWKRFVIGLKYPTLSRGVVGSRISGD